MRASFLPGEKGQRKTSGPVRAHVAITTVMAPDEALLPVNKPQNDHAGEYASNGRCCKIVPEKCPKLHERHIAACVAMTTVRGYSQLARGEIAPRVLSGSKTCSTAGVFFSSARRQGSSPRNAAPHRSHLRLVDILCDSPLPIPIFC